jgi:SulP family sulfate permease
VTARVAAVPLSGTRPTAKDLFAGMIVAIVTLAGWLTVALLAYVPLGAAAAEFGIPAACITVSLGGVVVAALGRSALPVGGLSSATVLIFAGAVAQLAADPLVHLDHPSDVRALIAVASCSVILMGLVQILIALLRLGSLARYVPQPVLAGFMNGVALLVMLAQLPMLLGIATPIWMHGRIAALSQAQPATLAVGLATTAAFIVTARLWPRAPAALVGLGVGCALYAVLRTAAPELALGPLAGANGGHLSSAPTALLPLFDDPVAAGLLSRHAQELVITGALLAIVGSLEIVLNALATDQQLNRRHDPNRELLAFAIGNLACGLFGGLPLVYWRARAAALARAGSATHWAAAACAIATALLYAAGSRLIALLPLAVLAGIMVMVAWGLVDRWTRALLARSATDIRSRDLWLNLALVAVVFGVTVWHGFLAGVGLGILLAMGLFIQALNRSLVRARWSAADQPSRRLYPAAQEAVLREARQQILVIELEGVLFFGNADRLAAQLEQDPDRRFVVIDLRRISMIDASGATLLAQLGPRLAHEGRRLLLAGVAEDNRHGRALVALSASGAARAWFADADQAVEAAEMQLLEERGLALTETEIPLEQCSLLHGLDAGQLARLQPLLPRRRVAVKELLFCQGDPGDRVYVLTRGSITVSSAGDDAHRLRQRYVSFSPGMMLGETAMLDGQGRTADAIADAPSVVHTLTREALEQLRGEDPVLAERLMTNIARHLSERLRHAAAAWRNAAN